MIKPFNTVATRFALAYWFLFLVVTASVLFSVYFGTVGLLQSRVNSALVSLSNRLVAVYRQNGESGLADEIARLLHDNIDQDTEDYLLVGKAGTRISGNFVYPGLGRMVLDRIADADIVRYGQTSYSRLLPRRLPNGDLLVVGRDLQDQIAIRALIVNALAAGGAASMLFAGAGAILFRRTLEHRVALIRRVTQEIGAGDLSRRIPLFDDDDEFARLNRDINRMLDHIQRLVDGVRNVSNAIAHDLRTPLGRIRVRLEQVVLRSGPTLAESDEAARATLADIDSLMALFDNLLQIAEAESGSGRKGFQPVALNPLVADIVDLYGALAESDGIGLTARPGADIEIWGDRNLLATALANLIDNALKHAGPGAAVEAGSRVTPAGISLYVRDDGPGIPVQEREKVKERFYRLDRSRSQPGNGLGLSIVAAIARLHDGQLILSDAAPGLLAEIALPASNGIVSFEARC